MVYNNGYVKLLTKQRILAKTTLGLWWSRVLGEIWEVAARGASYALFWHRFPGISGVRVVAAGGVCMSWRGKEILQN